MAGSDRSGDDLAADVLPLIDVRSLRVNADAETVWAALGRMLAAQARRMGPTARLLGANPGRTAGDPLHAGSTVPGFAVVRAARPTSLTLRGQHRFSTYELTFRLATGNNTDRATGIATSTDSATDDAASIEVSAESRAKFPGLTGRVYRALVIGSGGHAHAVGRMLADVARRSSGPD